MREKNFAVKNFVSILEGTLPLLLTCSHDGPEGKDDDNCPGGFPPRNGSNLVPECRSHIELLPDSFTRVITIDVAQNIFELTKQWPFVVIFQIARRCIDVNRPQRCAYESPAAAKYYCQYHLSIGEFIKRMYLEHSGRPGLLLDIHGAKDIISNKGTECDIAVGTNNGRTILPLSYKALFDQAGLVYFLKRKGYRVCPRDKNDCEISRYNGGYTVESFSSYKRNFRAISIQLEIAKSQRETESQRKVLASDLAEAIVQFWAPNYK